MHLLTKMKKVLFCSLCAFLGGWILQLILLDTFSDFLVYSASSAGTQSVNDYVVQMSGQYRMITIVFSLITNVIGMSIGIMIYKYIRKSP